MGGVVAEAKAKVRDRHGEAIKAFKIWLVRNPDAPAKKKFKTFDMYVDSAALNRRKK
jgi:hypothetical protein